jgi:hypothetical protein
VGSGRVRSKDVRGHPDTVSHENTLRSNFTSCSPWFPESDHAFQRRLEWVFATRVRFFAPSCTNDLPSEIHAIARSIYDEQRAGNEVLSRSKKGKDASLTMRSPSDRTLSEEA